MNSLRLFPLHTVLFPGMPLTLHIFEERYKQMIRECLDSDQPFGVVLIRKGSEALGPLAEPHLIGCTARIVKSQPLDGGRMNLIALGEERFRILGLDAVSTPYLMGKVDAFPLAMKDDAAAARQAMGLKPLVHQYMHLLEGQGNRSFQPEHIPNDPASLAYAAAILLRAPDELKQELLSIPEAVDLLSQMQHVYRRELAILKSALLVGGTRNIGVFTEN